MVVGQGRTANGRLFEINLYIKVSVYMYRTKNSLFIVFTGGAPEEAVYALIFKPCSLY
jgi:hypothetical protein